jgi:hypothetical protein
MESVGAVKLCNGCKQKKPFECFSTVKPGCGDKNNLRSRCKECRSEQNLAWHRENPLRAKNNRSKYYGANLEKERAQAQNWREANRDRHSLNNRIWKQLNPSMNAKNASSKRVKKLQATPNWLTAIHHAQIQEMYDVAVARTVQTGIRHHVDHVFPLQGSTFSGLHVPWNLQVLTEFDNLSKKNKFPREYLELSWENV